MSDSEYGMEQDGASAHPARDDDQAERPVVDPPASGVDSAWVPPPLPDSASLASQLFPESVPPPPAPAPTVEPDPVAQPAPSPPPADSLFPEAVAPVPDFEPPADFSSPQADPSPEPSFEMPASVPEPTSPPSFDATPAPLEPVGEAQAAQSVPAGQDSPPPPTPPMPVFETPAPASPAEPGGESAAPALPEPVVVAEAPAQSPPLPVESPAVPPVAAHTPVVVPPPIAPVVIAPSIPLPAPAAPSIPVPTPAAPSIPLPAPAAPSIPLPAPAAPSIPVPTIPASAVPAAASAVPDAPPPVPPPPPGPVLPVGAPPVMQAQTEPAPVPAALPVPATVPATGIPVSTDGAEPAPVSPGTTLVDEGHDGTGVPGIDPFAAPGEMGPDLVPVADAVAGGRSIDADGTWASGRGGSGKGSARSSGGRSRIMLAILLVLALVAASLAYLFLRPGSSGSAVAMTMGFTEGQRHTYKLNVTVNGNVAAAGQTVPISEQITEIMTWKVTKVGSNGVATVQASIKHASISVNGKSVKVHGLSHLTFQVGQDGQMISGDAMALTSGSSSSGTSVPGLDQFTPLLPDHAVKPGDSWSKSFDQPNPFGSGSIHYTTQTHYIDNEPMQGVNAAVLHSSATIPLNMTIDLRKMLDAAGSSAASQLDGSNPKFTYKGTVTLDQTSWFDTSKNQLLATQANGHFDLGMSVSGLPSGQSFPGGDIKFTGDATVGLTSVAS